MAKEITRLNMWSFIKNENPPDDIGFMFWDHPKIFHIKDLCWSNNNNKLSMAQTIQIMKFIKAQQIIG